MADIFGSIFQQGRHRRLRRLRRGVSGGRAARRGRPAPRPDLRGGPGPAERAAAQRVRDHGRHRGPECGHRSLGRRSVRPAGRQCAAVRAGRRPSPRARPARHCGGRRRPGRSARRRRRRAPRKGLLRGHAYAAERAGRVHLDPAARRSKAPSELPGWKPLRRAGNALRTGTHSNDDAPHSAATQLPPQNPRRFFSRRRSKLGSRNDSTAGKGRIATVRVRGRPVLLLIDEEGLHTAGTRNSGMLQMLRSGDTA